MDATSDHEQVSGTTLRALVSHVVEAERHTAAAAALAASVAGSGVAERG